MTLSKLAKLANVSVSVVSKAFSGKGEVSDEMREHVFAVAREHGCFQQFYHVPYDRPVIAVIIPEAISQAYIRYVEALKALIQENGYTMLLSISNFDPDLTTDLIRYYTSHSKVDGLIVVDSRAIEIPPFGSTATVFFGGPRPELSEGTCIYCSFDNGANEILHTLYLKGHRSIAYVGDQITVTKGEKLQRLMTEMGMKYSPSLFVTSNERFEAAGIDGVDRLWSLEEKPTAIIGAYGYITKGILARLFERGIRIPDDVSVISLNDDPPPLHDELDVSTVLTRTEHICSLAMETIMERMRTATPNERLNIQVPSIFHQGNTVRDLHKCK